MIKKPSRNRLRIGKHKRIRRKVWGTPEKPRLCVFRSLNHIYAQVIDDVNHNTLVRVHLEEVRRKSGTETKWMRPKQ